MSKCPICKREGNLGNCRNCKGSGNSPTGYGYCEMCNGERKLCPDCQ